MSAPRILIPRDAITAFCRMWKIFEFALFEAARAAGKPVPVPHYRPAIYQAR